jgi:hypothetical protein
MVPWVGSHEADFARIAEQNFLKVEIANLNNALRKQAQSEATKQAGLGNLPLGKGPHSGSAAIAQAFAKSILWAYGWGMNQWPYEQALWNQESGWNAYAVNPSSGAYGIPQSLGHGHPYDLGDYKAQIRWGDAYISQRYGNPANAWGHERAYNWYDNGGWLKPGANFMWNGTGQREHLSRDSGPGHNQNIVVTLSFDDSFQQATGLTPAQLKNIKYAVRVLGGGDVQKAFGKK